jgi:hypothetical protein
MAITFEGVGTAASGTGDITPTIGTADTSGDIHVAFVENDGRQAQAAAPSGWTEKISITANDTDQSYSTRNTLYWTRSDGSTADPTFSDTGNHTLGIISTFRGCLAAGDPFDNATSNQDSTQTTSISVTGHTNGTNGCMVLYSTSGGDDGTVSSWANSNLVSITEGFDELTIAGSDSMIAMAYGILTTAGATGTTTATNSKNERQANVCASLEPAAVAGSIITPIMGSNLGSDLYNGTLA